MQPGAGMIAAYLTAAVALAAELAAAVGDSNDVGGYLQGGGLAALAGALIYIARKFASGDVVARDTQRDLEHLQEMVNRAHDMVVKSDERERKLIEITERSMDREDSLRALLIDRFRSGGGTR